MQILGILNITRDSFSDGGRYLEPDRALAHARQLAADGADIIDIGAESTHPDAEDVPADVEIVRLTPVVRALRAESIRVSVDTYKPKVMRAMLALGIEMINDVTALRDPESVALLRDTDVRVIIMHSTAAGARAEREAPASANLAAGLCTGRPVAADGSPAGSPSTGGGPTAVLKPATVVDRILSFFERRLGELSAAGIARERLILDPGMGFFLGPDPLWSVAVLRNLDKLKALGLPVCVSTSRKSFIGSLLGSATNPRPVDLRGAGTLASELWAAQTGADYIRTHDVRALRDGLTVWNALAELDRRARLSGET